MTVQELIEKLEDACQHRTLKDVRFLVHWSDGRAEYKIISIEDAGDYVEIELSV